MAWILVLGCFWIGAAFCPLPSPPREACDPAKNGGSNLETLSVFIKKFNAKFSLKCDSTTVAFEGDVQRTEGLTEPLRQ